MQAGAPVALAMGAFGTAMFGLEFDELAMPLPGTVRHSTVRDGCFQTDGTMWAFDGTVLAHSHQLQLLMAT
jgi:hypothetical protein